MKKSKNEILKMCFSIYSGSLIIQNILATKQMDIFMFTVTTGILISPIVFIIQDVISEIFGYKEAKKMVLYGFLMNFVAVILYSVSILIPPSSYWNNQVAFEAILGTTFRITLASFIAYIVGSLTNSKVMVALKNKNEKNLFFRAISSTIVGQFLDNFLFAFIAFYGVLPVNSLISMVIGGTIFEVIYEIVFYPITKTIINKIKVVVCNG